jgi:hypothetical protein
VKSKKQKTRTAFQIEFSVLSKKSSMVFAANLEESDGLGTSRVNDLNADSRQSIDCQGFVFEFRI